VVNLCARGCIWQSAQPHPSAGFISIPKSMREFIITLPFNDVEGFERVMRSYGEQIAAVISEPCQGNCAAINPQDGFLELIRKMTEDHGCVFILDEVKTGFRMRMAARRNTTASNRTWQHMQRLWAMVTLWRRLAVGKRSCPLSDRVWHKAGRIPITNPVSQPRMQP